MFVYSKYFLAAGLLSSQLVVSQALAKKLDNAVGTFLKKPAAYAATVSFFVADDLGRPIYTYGGEKGLSTASTQKIFTSACALETLGKDFTFTTTAGYTGMVKEGVLSGDFYITSNGDPTLGSWRYEGHKPEDFKKQLLTALQKAGIKAITGSVVVDDGYFDFQSTPGGWPWDDMGNYYGAGVFGVNWRENQFDVAVSGKTFKDTPLPQDGMVWVNQLEAAGDNDQSLIFTAPHSKVALINGSLPAHKTTTVSGAMPDPPMQLGNEIREYLEQNGIPIHGKTTTYYNEILAGNAPNPATERQTILNYTSPPLEKIVYWFLRKSINLYGETLIKTLGKKIKHEGTFAAGVSVLKDFWASKGLNPAEINFQDGSGLSPQNYVSARAEVQALLYARNQPWFQAFYEGFPVQANGMKMKSGTIRNVKSFAGYQTSATGRHYVFSIIVNNLQTADMAAPLEEILNNLK